MQVCKINTKPTCPATPYTGRPTFLRHLLNYDDSSLILLLLFTTFLFVSDPESEFDPARVKTLQSPVK